MSLAINGPGSAIAQALVLDWLPDDETVIPVPRGHDMPSHAKRYLFCQGLLYPLKSCEQSLQMRRESVHVNFRWIKLQCERILAANDSARICVLGSESGFAGSYDGTYAAAKRRLHRFVETTPLRPKQQLVCVAPSIIENAGMTLRRTDTANLSRKRADHPKRRFLGVDEVASLIHYLLYVDRGYLTGITIRMNGGAHAT